MSCQSCCAFDVPQIADFVAGGYYVYPTQGYSFVITTCPAGLVCQPGIFPQIININKNRIPAVPVPPNPHLLTLQGCQSLITATVPEGASASTIAGIAAGLQQQFAQQQANCDLATKFNFPTINTTTTVFNTDQTASCVNPQFGDPVTVPAGTVGVTIFNATPADIASAQAAMNQLALSQAKAQLFCFNPGPDWRTLTWITYQLNQGSGANVVSGQGVKNTATANLVLNTNAANVSISPVLSGNVTYTGPQVVCTMQVVVTQWDPNASVTFRPIHSVAGQLAVSGGPITGVGTWNLQFTVPLSNGATIHFDDASPGNHWAFLPANMYFGSPLKLTFSMTIFQ